MCALLIPIYSAHFHRHAESNRKQPLPPRCRHSCLLLCTKMEIPLINKLFLLVSSVSQPCTWINEVLLYCDILYKDQSSISLKRPSLWVERYTSALDT